MNNIISNQSNVNFQAKLDISKVKGSNRQWVEVAKIFESKTAKYKNDLISLSGSFDSGFSGFFIRNKIIGNDFIIKEDASKRLKELTSNKIAENIVSLYKFIKYQENATEKIHALNKFLKLDKLDLFTQQEKLYDNFVDIMSLHKKNFINKNPVFKDGLII